MADKSRRSKKKAAKDTIVEIHLPTAQYRLFIALKDEILGQEAFDKQIVQKLFPEDERFGLDHIRLVEKASSTPEIRGPGYTKTCSSS